MDLLRGTLDLLILNTLRTEAMHGYAIAASIRDATGAEFQVQEGVLYPALRKLEGSGLLRSEWHWTDTGRKARYYELTKAGKRELEARERDWRAYVRLMNLALRRA